MSLSPTSLFNNLLGIYPRANGNDRARSAVEDSSDTKDPSSIANEQWEFIGMERLYLATNAIKTQGMTCEQPEEIFWTGKGGIFSRTISGVQVTGPGPDYKVLREIPDVLTDKLIEEHGINHIGSPDLENNKLYLALEDGRNYKNPIIAQYCAQTLELERFAVLPLDHQHDGCPWVAIDNGTAYTSCFQKPKQINTFTVNPDPKGPLFIGEQQPLTLSGAQIDSVQSGKVFNGCLYTIDDSNDQIKKVFKTYLKDNEKLGIEAGYTEELFTLNDALESSATGYLLVKLNYLLFTLNSILKKLTNGYFNVQALKLIEAEGIAFYPDPENPEETILHASLILYSSLSFVVMHYRLPPSDPSLSTTPEKIV